MDSDCLVLHVAIPSSCGDGKTPRVIAFSNLSLISFIIVSVFIAFPLIPSPASDEAYWTGSYVSVSY